MHERGEGARQFLVTKSADAPDLRGLAGRGRVLLERRLTRTAWSRQTLVGTGRRVAAAASKVEETQQTKGGQHADAAARVEDRVLHGVCLGELADQALERGAREVRVAEFRVG